MRAHPDLAGCAVRCRRCGIRFLTHPRNADREDLRCEFGCRECHRRELANARSKKHYRTDRGWWNKKLLNGKRSAAASVAERGVSSATASPGTTPTDMETASSEGSSTSEPLCPPSPPPAPLPDPAAPGALEEVPGPPDPNVQLTLEGFTLDEVLLANSPLLPYLSAYLDFALSAPGVQRHRFTRELFALSRQLTSAVFGHTARRAHRYRIVDLATIRRIAWLCLSQEELVLPEPEVDEDFRQRPAYQEGYLTDPPDLSVYDQKSEERNEQHQDEENQDDQPF